MRFSYSILSDGRGSSAPEDVGIDGQFGRGSPILQDADASPSDAFPTALSSVDSPALMGDPNPSVPSSLPQMVVQPGSFHARGGFPAGTGRFHAYDGRVEAG